jgi:hypothetical protein
MDSGRHKVEVFSAGCALCQEVIDEVKREVGSSQFIVHHMKDARAHELKCWVFDPFRQS